MPPNGPSHVNRYLRRIRPVCFRTAHPCWNSGRSDCDYCGDHQPPPRYTAPLWHPISSRSALSGNGCWRIYSPMKPMPSRSHTTRREVSGRIIIHSKGEPHQEMRLRNKHWFFLGGAGFMDHLAGQHCRGDFLRSGCSHPAGLWILHWPRLLLPWLCRGSKIAPAWPPRFLQELPRFWPTTSFQIRTGHSAAVVGILAGLWSESRQ